MTGKADKATAAGVGVLELAIWREEGDASMIGRQGVPGVRKDE